VPSQSERSHRRIIELQSHPERAEGEVKDLNDDSTKRAVISNEMRDLNAKYNVQQRDFSFRAARSIRNDNH
jgi:hypothetical protein